MGNSGLMQSQDYNLGDIAAQQTGGGLDTSGGTAGGGNVLQYIGSTNKDNRLINEDFMAQLRALPYIKVVIAILLIIVAVILILKIFEIKSVFKGKTILNELRYLDKVKEHDKSILQANKLMNIVTVLIEHSPFALSKSYSDYWAYNLKRANVRIPGGSRIMKPEEFNAIIKTIEIALLAIFAIVALFFNAPIGTILFIFIIMSANTMPLQVLRSAVKNKDGEIVENFADFYLMLHYVLLASAGTPLVGIIKSFDKTTSSIEMHRFSDCCIHYMETYGEYEATRHIASEYREINQVGKLMRLIRQANEGGDVRAELLGFRNELLNAKRYELEKRMNKLIQRAQLSFNILVPILIQAVISAMAIYLEDLGAAKTFM